MSRRTEFAEQHSLPKPRFRSVRDFGTIKNSPKFFHYWASIPPAKSDRVIVKVFRIWPICDKKKIDPNAKKEEHVWRGKMPFAPEEFTNVFADQFGSGDWKVQLFEDGVSGAIAEAYFSWIDREQFPPKIDLRSLEHGPFPNKDYIAWLEKQPGLDLPWTKTPEQLQETGDMNVATVLADALKEQSANHREEIKDLKEKVEELVETIENGEEEEPSPEEKQRLAEEAEAKKKAEEAQKKTEAAEKSISTIAFETGMRMIEKQADRISSESAKAYNPIEVAESVMKLAEKMNGGNGGPMALITQFMENRLKEQADEAKFWRERALNPPNGTNGVASTAVATAPKTLVEQMEEMASLKSVFRELFATRERREPDRDEAPPKRGIVETFLESPQAPMMIQTGMLLFANIVYNLTNNGPKKDPQEALKTALGQPAAPNDQVQPQPGGQPAVPDPKEAARRATLQFLQHIEKPLTAHFFDTENQGLSGYTFANRMHSEFVPEGNVTDRGRAEYLTIRDQWGIDAFDKLIRSYAPLWELLQGHLPKYQEFLKQFMDYDRWIQEQQDAA